MNNQQASVDAPTSFRAELTRYWALVPDKGLFFGLLAAWLALFHFFGNSVFGYVNTPSLLAWLFHAYTLHDGDDGHGLLVPLAVVALLWWKRRQMVAQPLRPWPAGLLAVAAALLLHVVGYLVQQPPISTLAFLAGVYALMAVVWGPAWCRAGFFPCFLFLFCIPISHYLDPVTLHLRTWVSWMVQGISSILGIDVVREGTQLFNAQHTYSYEVAAACSGMRSLVSTICLATIFGFMNFDRSGKRLLIVAAAVPLAVLGNLIRLMGIIITAEFLGQSGGDYVHENAIISLLPYVNYFSAAGDHVYVTGYDTNNAQSYLTWDGASWQPFSLPPGSFNIGAILPVRDRLYVSTFLGDNTAGTNTLMEWKDGSWQRLGDIGLVGGSGDIYTMAAVGRDVYVCGYFNSVGGLDSGNFAIWHEAPEIRLQNLIKQTAGQFTLEVSGLPGDHVELDASTNFIDWTSLATNILTGELGSFLDQPPANSPRRFYRATLLP